MVLANENAVDICVWAVRDGCRGATLFGKAVANRSSDQNFGGFVTFGYDKVRAFYSVLLEKITAVKLWILKM